VACGSRLASSSFPEPDSSEVGRHGNVVACRCHGKSGQPSVVGTVDPVPGVAGVPYAYHLSGVRCDDSAVIGECGHATRHVVAAASQDGSAGAHVPDAEAFGVLCGQEAPVRREAGVMGTPAPAVRLRRWSGPSLPVMNACPSGEKARGVAEP
jgi:hypothetical protein